MDTFKIKAILTAVEKKSLSKAAEEYSYTPSAFSHMLTAFEEELGVKIFNRTSTGVYLTYEGEKILPEFKRILKAEEELYNVVSSFEKKNSHSLTVALYASLSDNLLPSVLKKFRADNPNIDLKISVVDELQGWLENDKADLVIGSLEYGEDYVSVPLFEDEFIVLGTKELLNGVKVISRDDIYDYPFIFLNESSWNDILDINKFKNCINFKSEDNMSVFNFIRNGFGVTLFPKYALSVGAKGLAEARIDPPLKRTISYSYKKSKRDMFALKKFIKLL